MSYPSSFSSECSRRFESCLYVFTLPAIPYLFPRLLHLPFAAKGDVSYGDFLSYYYSMFQFLTMWDCSLGETSSHGVVFHKIEAYALKRVCLTNSSTSYKKRMSYRVLIRYGLFFIYLSVNEEETSSIAIIAFLL